MAGGADEDRKAFLKLAASRYFRIVSQAIKKADPNHMYVGSRFHGRPLRYKALFEACGPYVDAMSINYYKAWNPSDRMNDWLEWSGTPFFITEWYANGMDSGIANSSGAGWIVKTQKDRGLHYQNFTLALLEHPGCVGWHWFKYIDNDPEEKGIDPSNVDSNKGVVSL